MASYNTLQAITDNASGLSTIKYYDVNAALPYIKALKLLFADFESELEQEKTAPTGETVEAAKETIPCVLSANNEVLSIGDAVLTRNSEIFRVCEICHLVARLESFDGGTGSIWNIDRLTKLHSCATFTEGKRVLTAKGYAVLGNEVDGEIQVELDNGFMASLELWEIWEMPNAK